MSTGTHEFIIICDISSFQSHIQNYEKCDYQGDDKELLGHFWFCTIRLYELLVKFSGHSHHEAPGFIRQE